MDATVGHIARVVFSTMASKMEPPDIEFQQEESNDKDLVRQALRHFKPHKKGGA
jgi:hypothetical protein